MGNGIIWNDQTARRLAEETVRKACERCLRQDGLPRVAAQFVAAVELLWGDEGRKPADLPPHLVQAWQELNEQLGRKPLAGGE